MNNNNNCFKYLIKYSLKLNDMFSLGMFFEIIGGI